MSFRRRTEMLCMLLKFTMGKAHTGFEDVFPNVPGRTTHGHDTRIERRRHDLQLFNTCGGSELCQFQRSLYGIINM